MRTHWLEQRPYWTGKHPACGVSRDRPASEDPGDVTCLTCQRRIEADMRSPDDVAEEQGAAKARQRARARAVSDLIARHEDEFNALWDGWAVELHDECVKEARAEIEQRARWDREWREQKKEQLLAQLESLGERDV